MAVIDRRPHVRPGLRRFAIVAFTILIPIALHTLWDHIEARRLARVVAEIRSRNEPVSSGRPSAFSDDPENAARYYDAAAALIDRTGWPNARALLTQAEPGSTSSDREDILRQVRLVLERNRESEAFIARASTLPYKGRSPSSGSNTQFERINRLAQLARLRTLERLAAGDALAAANSVVQQLQIVRTLRADAPSNIVSLLANSVIGQAARDVGPLLELHSPDTAVDRIQAILRGLDNDGAIEQTAIAERSFNLDLLWSDYLHWYRRPRNSPEVLWYLARPFLARRLINETRLRNELIETARRPWPERLHVFVPDRPSGRFARWSWAEADYETRSGHRWRTENAASALAVSRTADAAIAVARYQAANTGGLPDTLAALVPNYIPAVPIDPYSGQEIRYVKKADRFAAYSVGPNEKDDGGVRIVSWVQPGRAGALQDRTTPMDLGLEVRLRRNR